jgi:hypothetical protein
LRACRRQAAQTLGVELGGGAVRLDQPAALALLLAGDVAALLVPQVDAGPAASRSTASVKLRLSIFCTNLMTSPPSAHEKQ